MRKTEKSGTAKIRVFFAEIEGDDQTIQDALRSIGSAVNKTFQSDIPPPRMITVSAEEMKQLPEAKRVDAEADYYSEPEEESVQEQPASTRNVQRISPKKKPQVYTHVKDLNLHPEGKQTLREFFASKKPSDQQQKLTVIVYYLCRILEISDISPNHVYTGLKDVGARVPPDIAQILRNTAQRKGWIDSSNAASLKTTTGGDNFVEYDLPKKENKQLTLNG